MITIEQLKDIKERTEALNRYLDIEGKKIQVEEEQLRTQAPGFWDDQKAACSGATRCKGCAVAACRPNRSTRILVSVFIFCLL